MTPNMFDDFLNLMKLVALIAIAGLVAAVMAFIGITGWAILIPFGVAALMAIQI